MCFVLFVNIVFSLNHIWYMRKYILHFYILGIWIFYSVSFRYNPFWFLSNIQGFSSFSILVHVLVPFVLFKERCLKWTDCLSCRTLSNFLKFSPVPKSIFSNHLVFFIFSNLHIPVSNDYQYDFSLQLFIELMRFFLFCTDAQHMDLQEFYLIFFHSQFSLIHTSHIPCPSVQDFFTASDPHFMHSNNSS